MPEQTSTLAADPAVEMDPSRRLRLLIVSHHFPSFAKPTHAIYNKQQFNAMAARLDIKVLVPVDWVSWLRHGKRALSGDSPLDVEYVPYFYVPRTLRRFTAHFMGLSIGPKFRRLLEWKPDAVFASWAFPDGVAVRRLLENSDTPFFCQVLGSDVNVHCLVPSRKRQIVEAFNSAQAVIAVSAAMRSSLISHGVEPERVAVVYNGVDDDKFYSVDRAAARSALELRSDGQIFLFVGNLKEPKGPFDLLEAFRRLAEQGRSGNAMLVYIGDGPGRPRLESLGAELEQEYPGLRVLVRGSVPHEQINDWMNAADFVCLPSHSEGLPNVVLEAMRCGTPVIASDVGGIPEVLVPQCGVMVKAKDVESIAAGIEQAQNTKWDRNAIREHSNKFQWANNADQVYRMISAAVTEEA